MSCVEVEHGIIHGPALRNHVPGLVLFEVGRQVGVGDFHFGLQVVRLDHDVIQLDLLILALELRLHFVRTGGDAVGHQLLKFLLEQFLFHFRLKFRHVHLKARLDFRGVAVHPDEGVSIERRRYQFAKQVGMLFIGDPQSQPVRLEFQAVDRK